MKLPAKPRIPKMPMMLLGLGAWAGELEFQQVVLDAHYIAYERDVGDIDGDGANDVVTVQEADTNLQWFRAPNWTRSTLVAFEGTFRYPRADDLKLADIDQDGDLDIVTRLGISPSDDGDGIAIWCENQAAGSHFVQHTIGKSPQYVKDIVVADFDRDARLDVAMRMDSETQIWLQASDSPWTEVRLSHPSHEGLEAGDLNMDGRPDLIMNGFWFVTPGTSTAARNATNYSYRVIDEGWFNQTGDWTANSCKVAVGDFDGDGTNDVAFSHSERADHEVAWYRSAGPNADGAWIRHPITTVDYCHTLQAADFNLDGHVDLLAGGMVQSRHKGLRLLLNNERGTNWTSIIVQTNGSYSAETGDIDNDGDLDIVGIRNWDSAPTWIYRNPTRQSRFNRWSYHRVTDKHVRTFGLCFPDVDEDGDLDIASGPFVYLNPGPPMTQTWPQVPLPENVHAFVTLDVDGDEFSDLLAQKDNAAGQCIDLYWVEAENPAGTRWGSPVPVGQLPRSDHPQGFQGARVAPLTGGSRPEIVISTLQGIFYFTVPEAKASAGAWPRTFVAPNDSDEGIAVADIDQDGHLDIAFTSGLDKKVKWARNPGDGGDHWSVSIVGSFPEADWPDRCEAVDLNGDNLVDIVVTEENSGQNPDALACWWEQPAVRSPNVQWPRHPITRQFTMNSLDVGDLDQDGKLDLILAEHRGTRRISVWHNDGHGVFSEQPVDAGHESHLGGRLADLDGDGDLDLVSIAYDDFAQLHLWRNDSTQPPRKAPASVRSRTEAWGGVEVTFNDGVEGDGTILLQNRSIRVRYTSKRFADGNKDHVITDFLVKKTGTQLAAGDQLDGIWMDADEGRGKITAAWITVDDADRKTIRVEWDDGKVVQELTIGPELPVIRMDYFNYGVNIVDMVTSVDCFAVYGAPEWQQARAQISHEALFNIANPHHRLTRDLYPEYPYPLLAAKDWAPLDGHELTYEGHLILGAYQQENGVGFGRVYPIRTADYVKLLKTGFEVFPCWRKPRETLTAFLFAVSGGPDEIISTGKRLAEGALLGR